MVEHNWRELFSTALGMPPPKPEEPAEIVPATPVATGPSSLSSGTENPTGEPLPQFAPGAGPVPPNSLPGPQSIGQGPASNPSGTTFPEIAPPVEPPRIPTLEEYMYQVFTKVGGASPQDIKDAAAAYKKIQEAKDSQLDVEQTKAQEKQNAIDAQVERDRYNLELENNARAEKQKAMDRDMTDYKDYMGQLQTRINKGDPGLYEQSGRNNGISFVADLLASVALGIGGGMNGNPTLGVKYIQDQADALFKKEMAARADMHSVLGFKQNLMDMNMKKFDSEAAARAATQAQLSTLMSHSFDAVMQKHVPLELQNQYDQVSAALKLDAIQKHQAAATEVLKARMEGAKALGSYMNDHEKNQIEAGKTANGKELPITEINESAELGNLIPELRAYEKQVREASAIPFTRSNELAAHTREMLATRMAKLIYGERVNKQSIEETMKQLPDPRNFTEKSSEMIQSLIEDIQSRMEAKRKNQEAHGYHVGPSTSGVKFNPSVR